jgi:hypothetical protein
MSTVSSGAIIGVSYKGGKSFAPTHLLLDSHVDSANAQKLIAFLRDKDIAFEYSQKTENGVSYNALAILKAPKDFGEFLQQLTEAGLATSQAHEHHRQLQATEEAGYTAPFNPLNIFSNTPLQFLAEKFSGFRIKPGIAKPVVASVMSSLDRSPERLGGVLYAAGDVIGYVQNPIYNTDALRGGAGDGEGIFYGLAGVATGAYLAIPDNHTTRAEAVVGKIVEKIDSGLATSWKDDDKNSLGDKTSRFIDKTREKGGLIGNVSNMFSGAGLWMSSFKHKNPFSFVQGSIVTSAFANANAMETLGDKYIKPVEAVAKAASPITRLLPQSVRDYVTKHWEISKVDTNHSISFNKNHNLIGFISMAYQLFNGSRFRKQAEKQFDAEKDPRYAQVKAVMDANGNISLTRAGDWKDLVKNPKALQAHMQILRDGFAVVSLDGSVAPLSDEQRSQARSGQFATLADGSRVMPIPHAFDANGWNSSKHGKTTTEWRYDQQKEQFFVREKGVEKPIDKETAAKNHMLQGPAGFSDYFNTLARYQTTTRDPLATLFRFVSTGIYLGANGVLGGVKREADWLDKNELFASAAMAYAEKLVKYGPQETHKHNELLNIIAEGVSEALKDENLKREKYEYKTRLEKSDPSFTLPRIEEYTAKQCADMIVGKLEGIATGNGATRQFAEAQLLQHSARENTGNGSSLTHTLEAEANRHHHPVDIGNIAVLAKQAASQVLHTGEHPVM